MPFNARVWLVLLLFPFALCREARARDSDVWAAATAGVTLGRDPIRFTLIEARQAVGHRWNVGAAIAYLDSDADADEVQLRLMATGAISTGHWSLDWRQLVSASSQDVTRFRSRLRVVRSGFLGHDAISLRAFDELFVDLEGAGVVRNNVAAGFGVQLQERCSAELYHVWVDDRAGRPSNYALLLLTLRF